MAKHSQPKLPFSRPNYLYAIISVGVVLLIFGCFGLLVIHAGQLLRFFREEVDIVLEFKPSIDEEAITTVRTALEQAPYVIPGSVRYISKSSAREMMIKEFGKDFLTLDLPNPFYEVLTFNVKSSYMDPQRLAEIRESWRSSPAVNDIFYQEGLLDAAARNIRKIGLLLLAMGILLAIMVGILVYNTVRLSLYANRFLIKTMELVGASWSFISRPYLWRAARHGLLSAMLAIAGLYGLLQLARANFPELAQLADLKQLLPLAGILILLGVGITTCSTWFVVNKYLKMRMDDLY